jgi:hypothetical protein
MVAMDIVMSIHIANNILNPSIFNFEIPSFEIGHLASRLGDNLFPLLDVVGQNYVKFYMPGIGEMF